MLKTLLITGVGGDIGQSIIKCLKDSGYNFNLIGCDIDFYAAGRSQVNNFYKVPYVVDEAKGYLDFLERVIEKENVTYIFPSTEEEIIFFDRHRNYFNDKRVTIFINNSTIIKTFFDKFETLNFLKKHNFSYPRTYLLEEYETGLLFPVLLKPRTGHGGKNTIVIKDAEELAFFKKRIKGALVQEIVGNIDEEYTVGLFSDGKRVYSIAFRRHLGYGSLTKVANLVDDKDIMDTALRLAQAVNLKGSINVQMRKVTQGYVILEVNPRLSSTVYTRHFFGFQDVKWWIDFNEGKSIEYVPKYKKGIAVRTLGEVFFEVAPIKGVRQTSVVRMTKRVNNEKDIKL